MGETALRDEKCDSCGMLVPGVMEAFYADARSLVPLRTVIFWRSLAEDSPMPCRSLVDCATVRRR